MAADLGSPRQATLDIINHQATSLTIVRAEHQSERFTLELKTLTPGQHYQLVLTLTGDEAGGRLAEPIHLVTDDTMGGRLVIPAYTLVHDRVYTFPETLDMGRLPLDVVTQAANAERLSQTLMVYRKGTSDFKIAVSTDLDSIQIDTERGPAGDRYQLTVSLLPGRASLGAIHGHIVIQTNEESIPEIRVPVTGRLFAEEPRIPAGKEKAVGGRIIGLCTALCKRRFWKCTSPFTRCRELDGQASGRPSVVRSKTAQPGR
ncbi:hypothetical protein [Marinobacterium litorale]|uniref:hypothetical protein n=1 Tax=Marinobacterium litorale TaxID=404770 RepID=UPI0012EBB9AD|nr:hypothetical protein [Marinobacterium litorale]